MEVGLKGKNIVVTGAARGIGREICAGFASNGSHVIGVDILDMGETGQYLESMGAGDLWSCYTIDLASHESVREGCQKITKDFPLVHALVNNGAVYGGLKSTPFDKIDLEEWDKVMIINVRGTYLMVRELLPALKAAKGKVINFASQAALKGSPNLLHYVASKGAIMGMTRTLANELGEYGITVNSVSPGFVENDASRELGSVEEVENAFDRIVQAQAIHERLQEKDIVGTVLYLASSWSDAVTGQRCPVDRGLIMH